MEKMMSNFNGLDMFQEFMSDCKVELNDNYDSFVSYNKKNRKRDDKENPTFMEFCLMEFITYSFKLFKEFVNDEIPNDVKMVMDMVEGKREELPN